MVSPPILLEIRSLQKVFARAAPDGCPAIDQISLSISPGQVVALLGESGAGKTTLLNMVAGRILPTRGTVRVISAQPGGMPADDHPICLIASGEPHLDLRRRLPDLLKSSPSTDLDLAARLVTTLVLDPWIHKTLGHWPRGALRRAEIAYAFSRRCPLLLVDELPGLDEAAARQIAPLIREHARSHGRIVIYAARQPAIAPILAGRILVLRQGSLVLDRPLVEESPRINSARYAIVVRGGLDAHRAAWFHASVWQVRGENTLMIVEAGDQAGLHGILANIRNMGLDIESLQYLSPLEAELSLALHGTVVSGAPSW